MRLRPSRRRRATIPGATAFEEPVAKEAVLILRGLADRGVEVAHARYSLAVALLMLSSDLAFAQRLLRVVEERHVVAGIDLHDAHHAQPTDRDR